MKRSTHVTAPLLAAAALALLTGCNKQMQRCVDEHNNVVDDSLCKNQPNQPQQRPDGHGGFIFVPLLYHNYYGGSGTFGIGTHADGGSFSPSAGASYTTRGGFGSSFAEGGSHSSSSGEGGGHGGGAGE
jgi:uncharacterized protein YgiB involved in biofilm formation